MDGLDLCFRCGNWIEVASGRHLSPGCDESKFVSRVRHWDRKHLSQDMLDRLDSLAPEYRVAAFDPVI